MIIYYYDAYSGKRGESHSLLEKAIACYTGDAAGAEALVADIRKGKQGKPYIDGFECFSISHSENVWAVLIADAECGLDVQFERKIFKKEIASRWFDRADADIIEAALSEGEAKGQESFFRIWTRREALAKAQGGSAFDSGLPSAAADRAVLNGALYTISDICFDDMPGLYAAVCIRGSECLEDMEFRKLIYDGKTR